MLRRSERLQNMHNTATESPSYVHRGAGGLFGDIAPEPAQPHIEASHEWFPGAVRVNSIFGSYWARRTD